MTDKTASRTQGETQVNGINKCVRVIKWDKRQSFQQMALAQLDIWGEGAGETTGPIAHHGHKATLGVEEHRPEHGTWGHLHVHRRKSPWAWDKDFFRAQIKHKSYKEKTDKLTQKNNQNKKDWKSKSWQGYPKSRCLCASRWILGFQPKLTPQPVVVFMKSSEKLIMEEEMVLKLIQKSKWERVPGTVMTFTHALEGFTMSLPGLKF